MVIKFDEINFLSFKEDLAIKNQNFTIEWYKFNSFLCSLLPSTRVESSNIFLFAKLTWCGVWCSIGIRIHKDYRKDLFMHVTQREKSSNRTLYTDACLLYMWINSTTTCTFHSLATIFLYPGRERLKLMKLFSLLLLHHSSLTDKTFMEVKKKLSAFISDSFTNRLLI